MSVYIYIGWFNSEAGIEHRISKGFRGEPWTLNCPQPTAQDEMTHVAIQAIEVGRPAFSKESDRRYA